MTWMDGLHEEARRRQDLSERMRQIRGQAPVSDDEAVARVDTLVRSLLDQINEVLLGGRGSVREAPTRWGVHLWELWWQQTREGESYLLVTLLRDSRGTPYLKVQGRRLALYDARLERRLQRALRAAFLAPRVYVPRVGPPAGTRDLQRPPSRGVRRAESGPPSLFSPASPTAHVIAVLAGPDGETRGRTPRARRRGRGNGRDDQ